MFSARRTVRAGPFVLHHHPNTAAGSARLGLVIPKKHARRAVLRNLLKRQAREAFRLRRAGLASSDLVFRLAQPVDKTNQGVHRDKEQIVAWRKMIDELFDRLPAKALSANTAS